MGPYTLKSEYRGTNTGWSTISRMSPLALGISAAALRDHSCPACASFFAIHRPERTHVPHRVYIRGWFSIWSSGRGYAERSAARIRARWVHRGADRSESCGSTVPRAARTMLKSVRQQCMRALRWNVSALARAAAHILVPTTRGKAISAFVHTTSANPTLALTISSTTC